MSLDNQSTTWVKVIFNCVDCGSEVECYGPFDSERLAEKFEPQSSLTRMSCLTETVVPINTKRENRDAN